MALSNLVNPAEPYAFSAYMAKPGFSFGKTYTVCNILMLHWNCLLLQFQVSWSFPFFSGLYICICCFKRYCLNTHFMCDFVEFSKSCWAIWLESHIRRSLDFLSTKHTAFFAWLKQKRMKLFVTRIFGSKCLDFSIPFLRLMLRYLNNICFIELLHYTVFKVHSRL